MIEPVDTSAEPVVEADAQPAAAVLPTLAVPPANATTSAIPEEVRATTSARIRPPRTRFGAAFRSRKAKCASPATAKSQHGGFPHRESR